MSSLCFCVTDKHSEAEQDPFKKTSMGDCGLELKHVWWLTSCLLEYLRIFGTLEVDRSECVAITDVGIDIAEAKVVTDASSN
jgi:hypothetical protein